jgi:hypothetical protein
MRLGVNIVAPFLFTKLITPLLARTAKVLTSGIRQGGLGFFLCCRLSFTNGNMVTADACQKSDLFFAICGGDGGN